MSAAKKNSPEQGISPISQEEFIRDFLPHFMIVKHSYLYLLYYILNIQPRYSVEKIIIKEYKVK